MRNPHPLKLRLRAWWRHSRIVRVSPDMQWIYVDEGQSGADFWLSIEVQSGTLPDGVHGVQYPTPKHGFTDYFRHTTRFSVNDKERRPPSFARKDSSAVHDYEIARKWYIANARWRDSNRSPSLGTTEPLED